MVAALESVMGRDAAHRLMTDAFLDLGMTQGKLHLSKPNVFHQRHCLKAKLVIFLFMLEKLKKALLKFVRALIYQLIQ